MAALVAACLWLACPPTALAGDANHLPPKIDLWAGGEVEGLLGPEEKGKGYNEAAGYFSTLAPGPSWDYRKGSKVSFACFVDGQRTGCRTEQILCCVQAVPLLATPRLAVERPPRDGYGEFYGEVERPPQLTPGWHTVTVVASDEDGTDPEPPTADFYLDLNPPTAPELVKVPARRGSDPKPRFRYFSTDDKSFPVRTYTSTELFDAHLLRLRPRGKRLGKGSPFGNYLDWRGPECPTPTLCFETDFAAYSANTGNNSYFGMPERLTPGLYEFTVRATDQVGNESALTRYRFRVLAKGRR